MCDMAVSNRKKKFADLHKNIFKSKLGRAVSISSQKSGENIQRKYLVISFVSAFSLYL